MSHIVCLLIVASLQRHEDLKCLQENSQVRIFSKTSATISQWLACSNFVLFATSQSFHLICRLGWDSGFSFAFFLSSSFVNLDRMIQSSCQFRDKDIEELGQEIKSEVWCSLLLLGREAKITMIFTSRKSHFPLKMAINFTEIQQWRVIWTFFV